MAAIHAARARLAMRGARLEGSILGVEVWVQSLSRALRCDLGELREASPAEVGLLWKEWRDEVQGRADREADEMQEWLRKRVNDDPLIHYDGAAAYVAEEGPGAFYGIPLAGLTRGQLLYYWHVRGAFAEWFAPGVTKRPTKQWLRS